MLLQLLEKCVSWLRSRKPKSWSEKLSVQFDEREVKVVVLDRLEPAWNQTFLWADIKQVCFMDGGLHSSDVILVHLHGRSQPAAVLTEASGGAAFLGALTERGYFPEEVWRRAMGETGGAMHCWPPLEK